MLNFLFCLKRFGKAGMGGEKAKKNRCRDKAPAAVRSLKFSDIQQITGPHDLEFQGNTCPQGTVFNIRQVVAVRDIT